MKKAAIITVSTIKNIFSPCSAVGRLNKAEKKQNGITPHRLHGSGHAGISELALAVHRPEGSFMMLSFSFFALNAFGLLKHSVAYIGAIVNKTFIY
jgi:hypothetical protein